MYFEAVFTNKNQSRVALDVSFCGNHLPKLITMSTGEVNTTYKRKVNAVAKVAKRKHKKRTALSIFLGDISQNIDYPRHDHLGSTGDHW